MGINQRQNPDNSLDFIGDNTSAKVFTLKEHGNNYSDLADKCTLFDDFNQKTLNVQWDLQKGSDAACANFANNAGVSGTIRATTGAGAGATYAVNGVQFEGELNWKANQGGLVFEAKVQMSAITNVALYVGFTDQRSALEMPMTYTTTTLTSNCTDGMGWLFDSSATTANWKLVGVANDVDATVQDAGVAPVAATYETLRIEVDATGAATFYRNGLKVGSAMTGATTATIALVPVIAGFARAAASRTIDADYIFTQQSR